MKKFWLKLCMLAIILTLSSSFTVTVFAYDKETVISVADQYVKDWTETDFQQYIDSGSLKEDALEQFTNWVNLKSEIGTFDSIVETSVEEENGEIIVKEIAKFEKGNVVISIHFDKNTAESNPYYAVTKIVAEKQDNSGNASLYDAGMNTAMGIGLVFIVLILISFIISLLQYVPKLLTRKEVNEKEEPVVNIPVVQAELEEDLAEDTELVAVITAAIMASMAEEAPADGLVVRSIRRRR